MSLPSESSTLYSRPPFWVLATAMIVLQSLGGICYPIAKYGLSIIEPYTFAFFRYILSSIVLLAMVYVKKREPRIERADWWKIIGLGAIIIPFNQTLFLVGQSLTGAGHGAFLFATTPIWVFVLAVLHLREKSTVRRAVGIAVATGGVMSIMWSGLADFGWEYLRGDLIIIVSVIAWAYYTIFGKQLVRKYGALRMTAYSLSLGAILYFPFGAYHALQYDYSQATLAAWGSVAYMAIALSVVVYVLWYWLLKYFDASRIAVYHNIQPIIASIVAYTILGESLSAVFLIGGAVVIVGVVITES